MSHLHFRKQLKGKSVMSDFISSTVLTWQVETITHLLTVLERVNLRSISSTHTTVCIILSVFYYHRPIHASAEPFVSVNDISTNQHTPGFLSHEIFFFLFNQQELLHAHNDRSTENRKHEFRKMS